MKFKSILLVDDEPGIIAAITRVLRSKHNKIYSANNGEHALEVTARSF